MIKRTPRTKPAPGARLFAEPDRPLGIHVANVDGASRGNPGPASYGLIVYAPDGTTELKIGKYLGRATNNVAEYYALIGALDYAEAQGIERLLVRSDSELLVRQMQGRYKVKSSDLRPLYEHARKLAGRLAHFAIEHVPRERNSEADELANIALDRTSSHGGQSSAAPTLAAAATTPSTKESRPARAAQRVRAKYLHGAMHTPQPMDLDDGDVVELQWKQRSPARNYLKNILEKRLLQDVGAVEGVALCRNVAGIEDDAAQFGLIGAVAHAGGVDHVFLDEDAADIVGAELPNPPGRTLIPGVSQLDWMWSMLSR